MDAANSIVYLNGRYLPRSQAVMDIEDRGTLFADGVYEVVRYYFGKALAMPEHVARLRRSLEAVELPVPPAAADIAGVSDDLVRRTGLSDAKVYWQVTRGPAARAHLFPVDPRPTVLAIAYPEPAIDPDAPTPAVKAILVPDVRWHLCSIKSLMLLPNVLAKQQAHRAGAEEALMHRDGVVTEGTSTSAFIVRDGQLWTHPEDQFILGGITRALLLQLAKEMGIPARQTRYRVDDLRSAREVFICGTTTHVAAVTRIDDRIVADGRVGPLTDRLRAAFFRRIMETCR